ncbi:MAG: DUF1203 domain-containing protein [Pseudomonadota bacterium]
MNYRVSGLDPQPFEHLFGLSDKELATNNAVRMTADEAFGFPDRIEMREVSIGESVLLVNHVSLPDASPYRASHAIFVREGAEKKWTGENEIPPILAKRLLSLRGFDRDAMIVDAEIAEGDAIEPTVLRLLDNPEIEMIHAHFAIRGCFGGRIERA